VHAVTAPPWRPAALLAGGVLLALAVATAVAAPEWTPVVAGVGLLGAGFAVMAPCELQMAATLNLVLKRRAATAHGGGVRAAALRFTAGYLLFYVPVALVLGALAHVLAGGAWVLAVIGGGAAVVLGLAALGRIAPRWLSACRGPLYLLRSGRAAFGHPFRAGLAFGQYCATCCGPYVYALVVFAGAAQHAWAGAALVMLYALAMAAPFLVPVLLAPARWEALGERLAEQKPALDRGAGAALVAVGAVVVPAGILSGLA
jgi:cytochrome c biogenesis protein CcdA